MDVNDTEGCGLVDCFSDASSGSKYPVQLPFFRRDCSGLDQLIDASDPGNSAGSKIDLLFTSCAWLIARSTRIRNQEKWRGDCERAKIVRTLLGGSVSSIFSAHTLRSGAAWGGHTDPTKAGVHHYPNPEQLPHLVSQMAGFAVQLCSNPISHALNLYATMLYVHPFRDGNAMAARCLAANYLRLATCSRAFAWIFAAQLGRRVPFAQSVTSLLMKRDSGEHLAQWVRNDHALEKRFVGGGSSAGLRRPEEVGALVDLIRTETIDESV